MSGREDTGRTIRLRDGAEVEVKPPVVGKSRWVRKGATARREKK